MKTKRQNPPSISDLPKTFILKSIARLPVKTVMACKCVCKNWYNLLSHPIFAKLHLDRSPRSTVITFVNAHIPGGDKKAYLFDLEDPNSVNHLRQTSFPDLEFSRSVIFGSCNGLILYGLRSGPDLYVCNPIVSRQIKLPELKLETRLICDLYGTRKQSTLNNVEAHQGDGLICGLYGIGYSRVSDKYKVIKVILCRNGKNEAKICEIGARMSWRATEAVPHGNYGWNRGGVFIDGALYWYVTQSSDYCNHVGSICCFDVATEKFFSLPPPPPLEQFNFEKIAPLWKTVTGNWCLHCSYVRFCQWGGRLSISYFTGSCMNMWVMREHGVKESWTKVFSIDTGSEVFPLGMLPKGEIFTIVIDKGDCAAYDFMTRKMVKEERKTREDCFVELVYKPTFISPGDLVKTRN